MTSPKPAAIGEALRRWWFLIVFLGALVAESAVAQYRLTQVEKKLDDQRETKDRLIKIEERQRYNKENQEEIKKDIKIILQELRRKK